MKKYIVTGGAGFIGSHLIDRLLKENLGEVYCIDNFDPFYDPAIKLTNMKGFINNEHFKFIEADIRDTEMMKDVFKIGVDTVFHIAAKAGIQPSLRDPMAFQSVNVIGTANILELARQYAVPHFIFASSSSVYGVNPNVPWEENDHVLQPISPYAATKVAGELIGHVYSKLYDMQFLALRFFTVYGPRQRPDLAIHKFTKLIMDQKPLPFYGDGTSGRDYTYVEDIIDGLIKAMNYRDSKYEIINIGNHHPVSLSELVSVLETTTGKKAIIDRQPMQKGDVPQTWANISKARKLLGYSPKTTLKEGIHKFFDWYLNSYNINS